MNESKIQKLFAAARSEAAVEVPFDFATQLVSTVRRENVALATPSAIDVLATLFPRLAVAALLIIGGLAYTVGALVYARRRPDPMPEVFGYHELFHALTIVAVACQYVAIASIVT